MNEVLGVDLEILLTIGAICVLLLLSGFLSGSETALTAASRARMHHLEHDGDRRARTVNRLSDTKERLIGTILFGNNLVNILASALATSVLIQFFGDAGVAYATLGMTVLVLVFAEVLPKTYALNNADRAALAVAPVIRLLVLLFTPVVVAVESIVNLTLRLVGVDTKAGTALLTPAEEILGTIDLHARAGGVVKSERDMLGSILELDEVDVSEIMIHRRKIATIDASEDPGAIIDQVMESTYTRLPLWQDDPENIIGVLHAKDVLRAVSQAAGNNDDIDIKGIASAPWFVPETTTLREQLNAFRERRTHFALVVDEYGALMGLVTLEDILEEIVGDISDEHDIAVSGVRPLPDGAFVIDGTATIRDLNRQFDWNLPDDEAATIAGLVIHEARIIPEIGQRFSFHGFRFEVLRRQRSQITSLRVTPPNQTTAQHEGE